jgi:aspartate/methionine/tyrosine aminotransferase
MIDLARAVAETPSSATIGLADRIAALSREGADIIDFSAGRAAEPTPAYIVEAAVRALQQGDTHQTPAQGTPEFLEAAAKKLARENGITVDPKRTLLATLGCKHGLLLALTAILDPGDEVLIEDPGFVSYGPTIRLVGGTPVPVPLRPENAYRWTQEELENQLTPRTKAIVLCSPQNPTGIVDTEADLDAIAEVAKGEDLVVIADETYERLTWGGRRHVSIALRPGMAERTVTLIGLTKSFAMGGFRIGFAHAPEPLTEAMVKIQAHFNTCASSIAQKAAAAALAEPPRPEVTDLWRDWEKRCAHAVEEIQKIPGVSVSMPEGGFYAWIDVREKKIPSEALAARLLSENRVALVPGSAFGAQGEGFLRMTCVASWENLREGLARLRQGLASG